MLDEPLIARIEGKPICVHASMRSLGADRPRASELLDRFLGIGCTVLVPTFTYALEQPAPANDRPDQNGWDYEAFQPTPHGRCFDPAGNELSLRDMGQFPKAVLEHQGRVRGDHPLNSFSAVGPLAAELIGGQSPDDVYSPLRSLCAGGGQVLMVGVDFTSLTLLHLAEHQAGRRLFVRWAKGADGDVRACNVGSCSNAFEHFRDVIPFDGTRIGQSPVRVLDAGWALDAATAAIVDQPGITRCGNPGCERCRDAILGGPRETSKRR